MNISHIKMLSVILAFQIPENGNSELQSAFNAAIMRLKQANQLNVLYTKYFGLMDNVDASVFAKMFGSIEMQQSDFFVFPVSIDLFLDCSPQLHEFPDINNITTDGALSNVLTGRKLYVLRSLDAPGFFPTSDALKIHKEYQGYEAELLQLIVNQISLFYFNEIEAIKVVFDENAHKYEQGWKSEVNFNTKTLDSNMHKVKTSTTLADFASQVAERKYHISAAGLLSTEMMEIGNFGCGTLLAEIGLMVNYEALHGLFELSEQSSTGYQQFKDSIDVSKTPEDIFNAISEFLEPGTNLPVCTKQSSLAHYFVQSEFSFCDKKCHFPNYFSNQWTETVNDGTGAWDAFVNGKCALFAADTTTMLALYKQLKDGINKGLFGSDQLKYNGTIKFNYLFAFDREKASEQAFDANMDVVYAKNSYPIAFAFEADKINHRHGNEELVRVFNFLLQKWAERLETPYMTEYGAALKNNFVKDKNVEEFVQIDDEKWLEGSTFAQFNEEERRNINKVYNKVLSVQDLDMELTAAIANIKAKGLEAFHKLLTFANNTEFATFPINDKSVLLYSIFVDNIASSRIYATATGTECQNASQPCSSVFIGKNELYNSIYKNIAVMPQSININFADSEDIYKEFFNAEYIPGTFVVTGLKNFNKGAVRYKKTSMDELTEEQALQLTRETIENMSQNLSFPDFIFLTDHFVQLVDGVVHDDTIKEIGDIVNSSFYNRDMKKDLDTFTGLFAEQLLLKNEISGTLLDGVSQEDIDHTCKSSPTGKCYFYEDFATKISYQPFLTASKNLNTCVNAEDFYTVANMYPLAEDTVSRLIESTEFLNENYTCELHETQLNNIPVQYHGFFDASSDKYSEVLICVEFADLPLALTSHEEMHPEFDPEIQYGAYEAILSKRVVKIGSYNNVKGFHDANNNGIEDRFLKAATRLFKEELGSSIIIISVNDLITQQQRLQLLQQSSEPNPDIDLIFSAEYADEAITYQQDRLHYSFQTYGRNYLSANISIITHISSKFSQLVQSLNLDEYIEDNAMLKNATFCVVAGSEAYRYFLDFERQAAVNNYSVKLTTNTETALSSLAARNCDIVMAHDTDATPWLLERSDFVFRSFESGELVLSGVFRRDNEDVDFNMEISFRDGAVYNMLWASIVLLLACACSFTVLCIGFRTYV